MLVLTRQPGQSISVTVGREGYVVTVSEIGWFHRSVVLLIHSPRASESGLPEARRIRLRLAGIVRVMSDVDVQVVEMKSGKVRLGIEAPRGVAVYRSENPPPFDPPDGAGVPARLPTGPKPPSLAARLDIPQSPDGM
jgi:sRNA-binding carbon storage regulator CsrA